MECKIKVKVKKKRQVFMLRDQTKKDHSYFKKLLKFLKSKGYNHISICPAFTYQAGSRFKDGYLNKSYLSTPWDKPPFLLNGGKISLAFFGHGTTNTPCLLVVAR